MMICSIQELEQKRHISDAKDLSQLWYHRLKHQSSDMKINLIKEEIRWDDISQICRDNSANHFVDNKV